MVTECMDVVVQIKHHPITVTGIITIIQEEMVVVEVGVHVVTLFLPLAHIMVIMVPHGSIDGPLDEPYSTILESSSSSRPYQRHMQDDKIGMSGQINSKRL